MDQEEIKEATEQLVEFNGQKVTKEAVEAARQRAQSQRGVRIIEIAPGVFKTQLMG
jgi:benzoyl-CoA reductase/2-hydroxyglutaryl-CoA dehydratase subunit BcrC/BadD/HgdB